MKKTAGWIIGSLELLIGFVMFVSAQIEISTNHHYTFRKPYTEYEMQVVLLKWLGIIFLISGIIWILLKLYQANYLSKHMQEIPHFNQSNSISSCPKCGLTITGNVSTCPRCGTAIHTAPVSVVTPSPMAQTIPMSAPTPQTNSEKHFCSQCGNSINDNQVFCPKCGNKLK